MSQGDGMFLILQILQVLPKKRTPLFFFLCFRRLFLRFFFLAKNKDPAVVFSLLWEVVFGVFVCFGGFCSWGDGFLGIEGL